MGILFSGNGRMFDRKKCYMRYHGYFTQIGYRYPFGGAIFSVITVLRFLNDLRFTMICAALPASPLANIPHQFSRLSSVPPYSIAYL